MPRGDYKQTEFYQMLSPEDRATHDAQVAEQYAREDAEAGVDGADLPLADAIVRYTNAVTDATKYEGMSKTRNKAEEAALRVLLKACGYGQAHLRKRVEAYIRARVD